MYHISRSKVVILDTYCYLISNLKHKKDLVVIQIWHAIGICKKAGYAIVGKDEGRSEKEAYREYFESELENVQKFSNFDVYGHLDYVVRYGPTQNRNYRYADYGEIIDEILRFLIKNNKGLEVNTGGFRCGIGSTNPCIDIIKRYHELGGRVITIGSDAHEPKYLTDQFSATCEMLQEIGFKYYAIYKKRQPEYFKLDTLL